MMHLFSICLQKKKIYTLNEGIDDENSTEKMQSIDCHHDFKEKKIMNFAYS